MHTCNNIFGLLVLTPQEPWMVDWTIKMAVALRRPCPYILALYSLVHTNLRDRPCSTLICCTLLSSIIAYAQRWPPEIARGISSLIAITTFSCVACNHLFLDDSFRTFADPASKCRGLAQSASLLLTDGERNLEEKWPKSQNIVDPAAPSCKNVLCDRVKSSKADAFPTSFPHV
jgi:hypothetical protein